MKLSLPDVTLVMVETREHKLARMAIEDSLHAAQFGDVLILCNEGRDQKFGDVPFCGHTARIVQVPDVPTKLDWCRQVWYDVPPQVRTSHMLLIQWDSWVVDPSMWRKEFLNYDFVGAPWWYKNGKNVGNSGFALKSTRLARFMIKHAARVPCDTDVEDDLLCRKYRPVLEDQGFRWAPEELAHEFAFECCRVGTKPAFGFHGMFNWPDVLTEDRLRERLSIAFESKYISNPNSRFMKALCEKHPKIMERILSTSDDVDLSQVMENTNGGSVSLPREGVS